MHNLSGPEGEAVIGASSNDARAEARADAFIGHAALRPSPRPGGRADRPRRIHGRSAEGAAQGPFFVDYLHNQRGATAVMPYSARSRPNAPVAAPVTWKEMETLQPAGFHVGDADKLVRRARSKALAGWGRADQVLPDL